MEMQLLSSLCASSCWRGKTASLRKSWNHPNGSTGICFRPNIFFNSNFCVCNSHGSQQKTLSVRSNKNSLNTNNTKEPTIASVDDSVTKKKGTVVGAIALIIGTSIGSGILAIPQKTSPAGFFPSAITIIICWGFLLFEALLLAEINVDMLMKKEKSKTQTEELEIISIRTMAQETLGEWGGTLATVNYVFLGYTTMVAYTSKSGQIISHLSNIPSSISGFAFTMLFSILISIGGTRITDQVNQCLTTTMIVLLVAIEVFGVSSGEWLGFEASANWGKVPATIPVIIFTLVYHDLAPVICAYLGGDLARIRLSFTLGSLVPLLVLLVWDALALGLSVHTDQNVDPIELLMRGRWGGLSTMVEAFSLLAVGTSLIGTLLGFSQFFVEQLNGMRLSDSARIQMSEGRNEPSALKDKNWFYILRKWWGKNKFTVTATAMAVAPPLFVSTNVPDVFSAATDVAGGYCMTMLYGVLPPAMAWAMPTRSSDNVSDEVEKIKDGTRFTLSTLKPALIGLGLFAYALVVEQILQDLSALYL